MQIWRGPESTPNQNRPCVLLASEGLPIKSFLKGTLSAAAVTAIVGVAAFAQEKKEAAGGHGIVHTADIKWTPIIKGCEVQSVSGDTNAGGIPFVNEAAMRRGNKDFGALASHRKNATGLKGVFQVGMGRENSTQPDCKL